MNRNIVLIMVAALVLTAAASAGTISGKVSGVAGELSLIHI